MIIWDDEVISGGSEIGGSGSDNEGGKDEETNQNEAIKITTTQSISDDYVTANLQIQIEYPGTITEATMNGESIELTKNEAGIYVAEKELTENGDYKIIAKDEKGKTQTETAKITDLTEDMEIWNRADMELFRTKVNQEGRTFQGRTVRVMADVNLEGSSTNQWTPIANFKGNFEGNGHTISHLFIQSNLPDIGLFGLLNSITVKDVTIDNSTIQGANYVGALAGRAIDATIENVHTTASVTVTATTPNAYGCYVGGLVGNIYGTISQSSNAATVTGSGKFIGGIVGVVNGTVSGCYNAGTIKVNGNFTEAGGIIGVNYPSATVTNCYNKGTINGYQNVGGIAGMTHNATGLYLTVSNCYNIGTVTGSKDVSEIVGSVLSGKGAILNCYTKSQGPTAAKLGDAFADDTMNINGGYPILKWQLDKIQ